MTDSKQLPPYVEAAIRLLGDKPKPGIVHVEIRHDDTCPFLNGIGPCVCDFEVVRIDTH